ncbi:molybdate ABC transporter substrate-binding protein [Maritalea sp.]|uniref:molybdate ABC transporter substrate-binding protein n=1 Tax=Maritalea sp. TaxID=2003361 RepID=UPI003EF777D7
MLRRLIFGFLVWLVIVSPTIAKSNIFVAASLSDVVQALVDASNIDQLVVVTGGSSSLARQIKAGAPADMFISANKDWAELVAGERDLTALFSNSLVLVSQQPTTIKDIDALPTQLDNKRLAIADPNHVPAGIYAQQALEYLGIWQDLSDKLAPTENVRLAARLVQIGAAPYGVVYASDAQLLKLNVAYSFPEQSHVAIHYWSVKLNSGKRDIDAFEQFLGSDEGRAIVAQYGFVPNEFAANEFVPIEGE